MIIRCKKCFKKYDDMNIECPRCGKINDRDYSKKETYSEIEHKGIQTQKSDHEKLSLHKKINKKLLRIFLNNWNCNFCGSPASSNFEICPVCFSSNVSKRKQTEHTNYPDSEAVKSILDQGIKDHKSLDHDTLNKHFSAIGISMKNWEMPYTKEFGIISNLLAAMGKFTGLSLLMLLPLSLRGMSKGIFLLLLVYLLIGNLVVWIINNNVFSEKISFTNSRFDYQNKISFIKKLYRQSPITLYEIEKSDIKQIELLMDADGNLIENIEISSKSSANVTQRIYSIDVRKFHNSKGLKHVLILYCLKNNIELIIQSKQLDESSGTESLTDKETKEQICFVRIDDKIKDQVMTEEVYVAHLRYLKKISMERPFKGGSFKKDGGMIMFSADSFETADTIAKSDPIILRGIYSYRLEEWDIKLSSENE